MLFDKEHPICVYDATATQHLTRGDIPAKKTLLLAVQAAGRRRPSEGLVRHTSIFLFGLSRC